MFQRVLWVSLTQALRSIALVLLPTAFISMLGWATAGSSNGNTSDPMRAALWLWLAAHHVPFNLLLPPANQPGFLSYLPLGALIFPIIAIRSSFIRARDRFEFDERAIRLMRILFALLYTGFGFLLALASTTTAIKPVLYYVPATVIPIVVLASLRVSRSSRVVLPVDLAIRIGAVAFGIAAVAFGTALAFHVSTAEKLSVLLQPGLLGGSLLLLFNILYIPNAVIATLAYVVGPGYAVGAHTLISPLTHRITEIPALPLLAALPTGRHPLVLLSAIALCAAGVVLFKLSRKGFKELAWNYVFAILLVALVSYLGSGSLLTSAMGTMGVSVWQVSLVVAVELGLGIFLAWSIPASVRAISKSRSSVE